MKLPRRQFLHLAAGAAAQIIWTAKPELLIDPGLAKLGKQCRGFAQIVDIGQLADQIGGTQKAGIVRGTAMLFVLRNGKSGVLYIRLNHHRIHVDQGDPAEPLAHEKLRSSHVIGSQRCVRRSIRQSHDIALGIADVPAIAVTTAYSPYVTYVMTQQRDYEMQPIAWRDTPLADVFAAGLPDQPVSP